MSGLFYRFTSAGFLCLFPLGNMRSLFWKSIAKIENAAGSVESRRVFTNSVDMLLFPSSFLKSFFFRMPFCAERGNRNFKNRDRIRHSVVKNKISACLMFHQQ